jgi:hypothetical protein
MTLLRQSLEIAQMPNGDPYHKRSISPILENANFHYRPELLACAGRRLLAA